MTAAVLQGAPIATIDTHLWINLPPRQYIRVLNLCVRLGARVTANTVVELTDDTVVNFLYRVVGLASFETEMRRALRFEWLGQIVKVVPLGSTHPQQRVSATAQGYRPFADPS